MLKASLIGLCFLVIITLENLILSRKKTIPVMLCDQLFVSAVVYFFFGWITLIYSGLLLLFLGWIKYRNFQAEESDLDFNGRIFSISMISNQLHKPTQMVVGTVLPVNHSEIKYNFKKIELDDVVLSGETLITGSTGSGKTTTLKTILKQRIDDRRPVVFVDYKGEEDILDEIKGYAKEAGLPYYEFSARVCTFTYDPFINLNETGKVEALMNTRRWSMDGADEHYKTSMQLVIQNLVREYDKYRIENNDKSNYIVGLYKFAGTYRVQANEREGFANLIKSLEILLSSKAKELFADEPSFTFEEDEPFVVCFSFTSANKALANQLSSFVFTDLMDRGTRIHYEDKLLLCVDEFGTLESSTLIKDLLEKGRSGGVQTVFSILDLNQISMTTSEFFTQSILGTINNYIIHAGATQKTAELLAGVQKYDKDFDIMSLRKPYRGKKPTALFITKYNILNKKNNQEVFRMIPYTKVLKSGGGKIIYKEPPKDDIPPENYIIPPEEVDLTQPIDNVEQYL